MQLYPLQGEIAQADPTLVIQAKTTNTNSKNMSNSQRRYRNHPFGTNPNTVSQLPCRLWKVSTRTLAPTSSTIYQCKKLCN